MESNLRTARYPLSSGAIPDFPNVSNSGLSDLFVMCQLIADNKPLTIPFRTSYKAFKNSYTSAP